MNPLALLLLVGACVTPAVHALQIVSDFEGGSVAGVVVNEAARTIQFTPGGDPARGWPCWWYFQVKDAKPGETITLKLHGSSATTEAPGHSLRKPLASHWAMPTQAAISQDGITWTQTGAGIRDGDRMTYTVKPEADSFFIAWGPPYTPVHAASGFLR